MKLFLDSADAEEIRSAWDLGFLDGVTMNPKLLAQASLQLEATALSPLLDACPRGPVCLPARGDSTDGLVEEARRLARIDARVIVKIPVGPEGFRAMRRLQEAGVATHATLCASASQALLAAKCGAIFVSPFIGRLEEKGEDGVELVGRIVEIYARYGFTTQVMVASVRHRGHVEEVARRGAQACTMSSSVLRSLATHPLTEDLKLDYKPDGKRER